GVGSPRHPSFIFVCVRPGELHSSLHDALPISPAERTRTREDQVALYNLVSSAARLFPHLTLELPPGVRCELAPFADGDFADQLRDRKSTRLNSSHVSNSYAVLGLHKKDQYAWQ